MKKNKALEPEERQEQNILIKFLAETQEGKYTEVDSSVINYERLPDYPIFDYEEQAYIFSYS